MAAVQNIRRAIEEANWDDLLPRLTRYTNGRMRSLVWRGSSGGPVPGGWEVNDFIQAAVRKALDGTRKWHPEEQDLLSFMKGIISSEVSSRATAIENANDRRATTLPAEADVHTVDVSSRQDESLSSAPSVVEYAQWRNLLLAKLEDPLERAIVTLVIDEDLDQPQEIADRLQVSVDEVYNAKKRLRRKRPQLEQT